MIAKSNGRASDGFYASTLARPNLLPRVPGTLYFSPLGTDTIEGFGGADFLNGSFGDDLLRGGAGNDILRGGSARTG